MAGIYIHIPFCTTRCIYCDFFSNTDMNRKSGFLQALCQEIVSRKDYLHNEDIQTIYFGGGTPSQLAPADIRMILTQLKENFFPHKEIFDVREITLEANPDDITPEFASEVLAAGINRISMGIQSFDDNDLRFLNRRHSAQGAIQAVATLKAAGFENISIDLMYGLPGQSLEKWQKNLDRAISLDIQHISSYHLIYEEGTRLNAMLKKGRIEPVAEELSLEMFSTLIHTLKQAGFQHYEISNFARPGFISRHNSSYWLDIPYIGLGPSAHSFNRECRSWNCSDLSLYIKGENVPETEHLTLTDRYNDRILTSLRTMWGLDLTLLKEQFTSLYPYCIEQAQPHIRSGVLEIKENRLKLTPRGIFISDGIMSDLMYIDD